MRISTKGRYAIRIMLDLSEHIGEGYISLKKISARQEISLKYLEAIVSILNKAGMVESFRGKEGGYKLTRRPEEYTIGSIIKLTEGSIAPVSCLDGSINSCVRACQCLTLPMWLKLDKIVDGYLESVTIRDLLDKNIK